VSKAEYELAHADHAPEAVTEKPKRKQKSINA